MYDTGNVQAQPAARSTILADGRYRVGKPVADPTEVKECTYDCKIVLSKSTVTDGSVYRRIGKSFPPRCTKGSFPFRPDLGPWREQIGSTVLADGGSTRG